ncbi:tRNA (adenosine(37)-N6)-threonylcarbamoyltransferase complex dimerization subunit type 1 TsaB [Bacillus sp. J14TS2]|uniref:tRNA (adenosine(37)-N6)-threonylcarbamoyltransferase complex dimerization subunit type 1 TsaB n=1 Tax=Bacillus sp. J14TS2 TaxID=2807188 RepID=UPI001B2E42E3|nr:tRNA (adenosine(37)-N6)-threonylcarbamoyltransferase complex dimerization subunit type 1 TsaB [Bacillus sp. J14TS2]GIN74781.1 tRNA (adenosine(37)-N6)-threonylcarbamoyltransferase complex dimerization subunit type 1 TsaB [Bacillus sp. J14TS2]
MRILAIDTSNEVLGISLLDEVQVIGEYMTNMKKNHSIRVMPAIEKLLSDCETKPTDLDKIVVAQGPGSYTGVRIGVTVAKTLAWALQIPLVGVSSLATLAASAHYFDGYISPLFDARRGLVYTGLYEYQDGKLWTVLDDRNILAKEWAEQLQTMERPILFMGNDISIHRELLTTILHDQACFAEMTEHNPRPGELGRLGLAAEEVSIHSFVPNYARLVEAEAKWLEKQERKN